MKVQNVGGLKTVIQYFEREKGLALTGLLGFLLAGICGVWVLLFGGQIAPYGDVSRAFSFNAALGIFLLTTAAILPFSGLEAKSRTFFRRVYIMLALYSYFAETVQHFRGMDPRFNPDGTAFDSMVGIIFGFVALLLVLFYLFLAFSYFRSKAYRLRPELVLGIRYAMIAVMLSFAGGIWLSFNQGRFFGEEGNIIWFHGLGFHALQWVPLVAWLTERGAVVPALRRRLIHIAGIAYSLGLTALGAQTLLGQSLFQWTVLPIVAACCFLTALVPAAVALRRQNRSITVER